MNGFPDGMFPPDAPVPAEPADQREPTRKRRRRRGSLRRTFELYRQSATPKVFHLAHKTFWQVLLGGSATSTAVPLAFDLNVSMWARMLLAVAGAMVAALVSFRDNVIANVDGLLAESESESESDV